MKVFITSVVSCLVISLITFLTGGLGLTLKINSGICAGLLILAMIFSGSFVSGDRMRANYNSSSKEDNIQKNKWTDKLLLISVPFVIVSISLYFLN
ncbi:DUF5316 domain-containing protein [Paenibacillus marinisediminis]